MTLAAVLARLSLADFQTARKLGLALALGLFVLASLPAVAPAAVSVGHSGWFWGNPTPQGETLNDVEFEGNRGYGVGEFGTVVRSDDGGASWFGLHSGTTQDLTRVQTIGPSTVIIIGGCSVRRSDDGGATFNRLPFTGSGTRCSSPVLAVDFPSSNIGYLAGYDGSVFRTADGGRTFSQRTAVPGGTSGTGNDLPATDLAFSSPDSGVAVGSGPGGGRVYRSTDGASSWTLVRNQPQSLNGVDFVTATTGYVAGNGVFLRTQDGGATFAQRPFTGVASQALTEVRCASTTTCLMTTARGDTLVRTTDAGATSSAVSPASVRLLGADFAAGSRAVAVGDGGVTVVSNNAGFTFSRIGGNLPGLYSRLRAGSGGRAYAPGADGRVARTLDGGQSWTSLGLATADDIVDVSFPTLTVGFALDSSGSLLRTDNGGGSWQILNTGTSSRPRAVLALDSRRALLVGPRGIRRSSNGGRSFGGVRARAVRRTQLSDVDRVGQNGVFAVGKRALAYSADGGRRWTRVRTPRGAITEIDFVSSRTGYLLQDSGRVFVTRNRGRRWTEVLGLASRDILNISFSDSRRGFATDGGLFFSQGARVQRTTDGGRSWQPQLVTERQSHPLTERQSYPLTDVLATGRDSALALQTARGHFLGTTSGGQLGTPSTLSIRPSRRRISKPTTVRLTGRLRPARGGEQVIVAVRTGTRWSRRTVRVASNGTFTKAFRLRRTVTFVAQWRGDDRLAGDGTAPVRVKFGKARRSQR